MRQGHGAAPLNAALASAGAAWVWNDFAPALAARARHRHLEKTLAHGYLARASTLGTRLVAGAGGAAMAATGIATLQARHLDLLILQPEHSVPEWNLERVLKIRTRFALP